MEKLIQKASYHFSGQIWRILADTGEETLAVEIRHGDTRRTDFAAIYQNKLLFQSLSLPENWWISGVALYQGKLLLHTYPDSQMPVPKGLIAVNVHTRNIIWQQPQMTFGGLLPTGILTIEHTPEAPIYRLVNLETGTIEEVLGTQPILHESDPASPIIYPRHYTQENKYFETIVSFLNNLLGIDAQKAFDYAEYQKWIIISYYLYHNNTLSNFLLVLDQQAQILLHEPIASQLTGIGLDTFFIIHHHLVFVREKKELIIYEL